MFTGVHYFTNARAIMRLQLVTVLLIRTHRQRVLMVRAALSLPLYLSFAIHIPRTHTHTHSAFILLASFRSPGVFVSI